jgi:hypothetical protein
MIVIKKININSISSKKKKILLENTFNTRLHAYNTEFFLEE